jgi:hypothetical protein
VDLQHQRSDDGAEFRDADCRNAEVALEPSAADAHADPI